MNFRLAVSALVDASRRNAFALAGLVVGTAAIIAMITLSLVVRQEAMRLFVDSEFDLLVITRTGTTRPEAGRRPVRLDLELADGLVQALPAMVRVAPVLEHRAPFSLEGRHFTGGLLGVTEAYFSFHGLQARHGRTLSDLDRFQPYAVLGAGQAAALGEGTDPADLLGRRIVIDDRVFLVIGVLAPAASAAGANDRIDPAILLPSTTFSRTFPQIEISSIHAQARRDGSPDGLIDEVRSYFRIHAEGLGLLITSSEQELAAMRRQLRLLTVFLGLAGALAFVLGGAGMLNGLLAAAAERRREIGLRRALGASRSDIRAQFLYEALLLSLCGAIGGSALGLAAAAGIAHSAGWTLLISPPVFILGALITVATGITAGSLPAWQAARLDPIQAMQRTE